MSSELKDIHAQLSKDYWMKAQFANLKWRTVLETGIDFLTGVMNKDEQEITEKIEKNEQEIMLLKQKLGEIREKNAVLAKKEQKKYIYESPKHLEENK